MQGRAQGIEYLNFKRQKRVRQRRYPPGCLFKVWAVNQEQTVPQNVIDLCSEELQGGREPPMQVETAGIQLSEPQGLEIAAKQEKIDVEDEEKELLELLEQTERKEKMRNKAHQEELAAQESQHFQGSRRQVSAFLKTCRVSLSDCGLGDFDSPDVLLIPFHTYELELYPGNILRDKLKAPCLTLSKSEIVNGGVYVKNKLNIYNFKLIVFVKVAVGQLRSNLAIGLNMLLKKMKADEKEVRKIVFCLDRSMDLRSVLGGITQSRELREAKDMQFCIQVQRQEDFYEKSKEFLSITAK